MNPQETLSHPEIDLRPILHGLKPKLDNGGLQGMTTLDFVNIRNNTANVKRHLTHTIFVELFSKYSDIKDDAAAQNFRIIFVADPHFGVASRGFGESIQPELNSTARWLHQHLGVPLSFFYYMDPHSSSGNLGTGSFLRYDNSGNPSALDGFYYYCSGLTSNPIHVWFSHSLINPHSSTYVIYNPSEDAKKLIFACAEGKNSTAITRPLAVDSFLAEESIHKWDEEVGQLRAQLLGYEKHMPITTFSAPESAEAMEVLHGISQHMHISREHLKELLERLKFLLAVRQQHLANSQLEISAQAINSITESIVLITSRTENLTRWVNNYIERTGIRIALFFNLTTQGDSRTNLDIARLTTKIAVATQRDSSSMITMAAVTMFFLPGSFVAGVFGMIFFDSQIDDQGRKVLAVTPQWWLFPLITIPLTILVFVAWMVWQRRRNLSGLQDIQPGIVDANNEIEEKPTASVYSRDIRYPQLQAAALNDIRSAPSIRSAVSIRSAASF